jgi:hypothetical protein
MGEALKKQGGVVVELRPRRARRVRGHVRGLLVGFDERGLLVDYPDNPHGPLVATTTVPRGALEPTSAASARPGVLLVFEGEKSDRPVVVGVMHAVAHEPPTAARDDGSPSPRIEALLDGRRVVLDANDEIVLRCGEASITLRRNGRVVIRGTYVETRSRGVNRVKGGSVQIN